MTIKNTLISNIAEQVTQEVVVPREAINSGGALYLAIDIYPTGSPNPSVLTSQPAFSDGDKTTSTAISFSGSWSIGYDLTTPTIVRTITLYDNNSNFHDNIYPFGTNDTLDLYVSGNNSTWSFVESFKPLIREVVQEPSLTAIRKIVIIPAVEFTSRYFKLHASNGTLKNEAGSVLILTELESFLQPTLTQQVIVNPTQLNVASIVNGTPLYGGVGDGTGGGTTTAKRIS